MLGQVGRTNRDRPHIDQLRVSSGGATIKLESEHRTTDPERLLARTDRASRRTGLNNDQGMAQSDDHTVAGHGSADRPTPGGGELRHRHRAPGVPTGVAERLRGAEVPDAFGQYRRGGTTCCQCRSLSRHVHPSSVSGHDRQADLAGHVTTGVSDPQSFLGGVPRAADAHCRVLQVLRLTQHQQNRRAGRQ